MTNRVVEGAAAADVALRVRHVVDGELVDVAPGRVVVLEPLESDAGRVGVPLASAEEASAMLELCAGGLARWLALGEERRKAALFALLQGVKARASEWATAWSDDLGVSRADLIARNENVGPLIAQAIAEAKERPSLRRGVHLWFVADRDRSPGPIVEIFGILASGAVVVLLPAPEAPRGMFELLNTALEAGLPAGAMNVIYAEEPVRYGLIAHPLVASVDGVEANAAEYIALGDAFEKPVLGLGETR